MKPLQKLHLKQTPVVKVRKPRKKATKPKRDFPQYSLEDCRKIADCLKEFNAGNPWAPGEVAKALGLGKVPIFFYNDCVCSRLRHNRGYSRHKQN